MTKREFKELTQNRFVFLDGATGSNLMKAGMKPGVCPEQWILQHPEVLIQLQKEYVKAGTNILYAPTFGANRIKLQEYGLEDSLKEMIFKLVSLSQKAADGKAFVAGDLTMTGRQLRPIGDLDFEDLITVYKEQITYMVQAGVDLLVVETMMSLQETRACVIAAKETCDLPIIATLTFENNGRTLFGTDAKTAAIVLESLGVDAVGVNCSAGPKQMVEVVSAMANVTNIPIVAKPNAGLPKVDTNGQTYFDMDSQEFAQEIQLLIEAGASILGGCCGTSPVYIEALTKACAGLKPMARNTSKVRYLCSERQTLDIRMNDTFVVVGERINPTGKKKFQESLRNGSLEMALNFAAEQEECGASVLDVNMGMSGIDEKAMMLSAIEQLSMATSLPLAIDSSHVDVIENALRIYPGRALINSISFEKEKFEKLIPIAKKYGAMFILLPLSDAGLPANIEEKIDIIEKIVKRALECGLQKEDIVVDALVNTIGANKEAALQALQTIEYCKLNNLATICGLSNISFGMPERSYVNTAFLTMAISKGLTMAIANPSQDLLMGCAFATDLLLAKAGADMRYIEVAGNIKERKEAALVLQAQKPLTIHSDAKQVTADALNEKGNIEGDLAQQSNYTEFEKHLYQAVLKGNQSKSTELCKQAMEDEIDAKGLLDRVLMPAIGEVGFLFEKGKYFLPQLISSAEAMKQGIEVLEPYMLKATDAQDSETIVIATVEGDIHDIGKNLVALMLKNHGFKVIDLGKDVPADKIVEVAKEEGARIIALSALMTTTMIRMKEVVDLVREKGLAVKVMIGGAVTTQDYADEIGADGYSKDAADAVKLAKRLLQ
ncbi:MAG: homocysteine S-methyltransferase family protein [Lachnospiraceae bacterium]|nr:homocysteine S-methyltransferase family protein [Lachnospiraceae bacterium]